jgi:hypothetical protein
MELFDCQDIPRLLLRGACTSLDSVVVVVNNIAAGLRLRLLIPLTGYFGVTVSVQVAAKHLEDKTTATTPIVTASSGKEVTSATQTTLAEVAVDTTVVLRRAHPTDLELVVRLSSAV